MEIGVLELLQIIEVELLVIFPEIENEIEQEKTVKKTATVEAKRKRDTRGENRDE